MDLSSFGVEGKKGLSAVVDKNLDFNTDNFDEQFKTEDIERFLPWFLKYKVEKFDDLIVTSEIKKLIDFIENFKQGKGLLLAGAPGSGKTTTLNLIGEKYEYEIFEMNASDTRNKKSIIQSVGDSIKQKSLFAKNKLILIDEVDGVSGRDDRGGVAELSKIVKESIYPVVFTANDKESDKIKTLKKVCTYIDFENHSKELLLNLAKKIFTNEKIKFNEKDLNEFIEMRNSTDIRGFINDLQACVFESNFSIDTELEVRDYKKKIEGLMDKVYYSYPEDSYKGGFNTDINLDDLFLYLEENTPNIYSKVALVNAFNEISKADVYRGKIMKWQHWRFLVYVNFYLTFGVSNAKGESEVRNVKGDSKYKRNNRILMKWIYGNKVNAINPRTRVQKNNGEDPKFIEKLAKLYGRSAKRTRSEDLRYFAFIYNNDSEFKKDLDERLNIDDSVKKALLEV